MNFTIRSERDRQAVVDYISKLDITKREYEAKIVKRTEKRTLAQNRLYHLWLNCISAETGNEVDILAEYFKQKFLGVRERVIHGDHVRVALSTTELNTEEFKRYLDRIQEWANVEQGIILPNPEDLYFAQFVEKYQNYLYHKGTTNLHFEQVVVPFLKFLLCYYSSK